MSCAATVLTISGLIPTAEEANQATPHNVSESEALRYCDHLQYAIAYSETYGESERLTAMLGVFCAFLRIADTHREARTSGKGLTLNLC